MRNFLTLILFLIISFLPGQGFAQGVPSSVSVVTGSYTVPARKYAKVVAQVISGGAFTINGVTALSSISTSWSVLGTSSMNMGSTISGGLLTTGGVATVPAFGSTTAVFYTSDVHEFVVPSGTVLNGSGTWRATVTLFERY